MTFRRAVAPIACVALAVGAVACGGDDDDGRAAAPATTSAETTEATETAPARGEGAEGLTPPGAKLSIGDPATVGWQPPSQSLGGNADTVTLEVTVESLEKGDRGDLEGIELDADQRGATPYFLKLRIRNAGGARAPADDDPDVTFDAIDDRGQEQGSIIFLGDFPRCENEQPPKPFRRGASYESCLTYLVPGGGSIEEVRWPSGPPGADGAVTEYFEQPVVWRGG